ncbi:MAG: hypothetical protein SOY73_08805 [Blautia sp.]|nr:hypothetical protein [Blautia sp.]MDY3999170.1 hypothetical protein [Blautia sp.]
MKIVKRLLPLLLFILALTGLGCSHLDKTNVEKVITSELDLLKNLDSETAQKYISYKELFPDASDEITLSDEIQEVFSLFFRNFDYKILDIDVDKDKKTATASIRLTTIDAHTLARDYAKAQLEAEILAAAASDSHTTEETITSLEERFLILNSLMKENEYGTVENNCTMQLKNTGDKEEIWEIKRTHSLENDLVGGLMTYLSDSDTLSAEDTLTIYLNTLKNMDINEMSNYLGVESIVNTSDPAKSALAASLVEQVHKIFNYEIKDCIVEGYIASVTTEITTFDSDAILDAYQKELDEYLSSPDAVIDGSQKRYQKSYDLLLDNIEKNTSVSTAEAVFQLVNDGVSWKLENGNEELGDAIFGTLITTPVEEDSESEE